MGFGKKKSAEPVAEAEPITTAVNNNTPDDAQKRGVPIADTPQPGTKPLLAPADDDPRKRGGGMLY